MVGFPRISYQRFDGSWLVTIIERDFVSILDDFEQIAALVGIQRFRSPVVQDQQIKSCDRPQQLGVTAISAAECEGGEETRHTMVGN
jgi:hypothetical protein